jgi:curved DNA-binding protein CbpA
MTVSSAPTERLAAGGVAERLRELGRRRATGRLDLVADQARRQLWFAGGRVCAVASDAENEKLGSWLVAQGLLDPAQMAVALLRQPDGERFGAFLVREGTVAGESLGEALAALAVAIVARLIGVPVECAFAEDGRLDGAIPMVDMPVESLLVAAVRQCEDLAGLEALAPEASFPVRAEAGDIGGRVQLSPQESYLLSRVDGCLSVAQLRRVAPLARDELTRCLAALAVAGVVVLRSAPPAPPAMRTEKAAAPSPEAAPPAATLSPEQRRELEDVALLAAECRDRDYYRRLGLTHGATINQVHERYREFARLYSPDRAAEPHLRTLRRELAEIQAALTEAYETLINPELRARYNESLRANAPQTSAGRAADQQRQRARRELARANVQRAEALVRAGDFGAAVQLLGEAVRAEPTADTLLLLARIEQRNPMWASRALGHLREAIALDPQHTDSWLELAAFWGRKGQKDRQIECLEKVAAYDPGHSDAARALAVLRGKG